MLKPEEIKQGQLVYDQDDKTCSMIIDVNYTNRGREKEKKYSLMNIITKKIQDNIYEDSHMTSWTLKPITKEIAIHMLRQQEGDILMNFGKIQKELNSIQLSILDLENDRNDR